MTADRLAGHAVGPATSAQRLVASLRDRGLTIATAESLTAGLISATIADVPGASAVLRGGLAAYTNDVKQDCLSIDPDLIERYGAISPECAEAMAYQARRVFRADMAVAATGVAGPEEQESRPVGTVFVAVATATELQTARLSFSGNRRAVRQATVEAALSLARSVIGPLRDESGGLSSDPAGAG